MDTAWTAPPGATQPTGIQSTAGAVPVFNEKGEMSMKKVKVQRYVSGKRPEYAPGSSDEEFSDLEDFTKPRGGGAASPTFGSKPLSAREMSDPRLRRLLSSQRPQPDSDEDEDDIARRRRVVRQAEVIEMSEGSDDELDDEDMRTSKGTHISEPTRPSHRLADSSSESEGEMDEEELARRRVRLRQEAAARNQQEEEVLGKEEEGSEESSEEESSEYSEETDSEAEGPRLKPVFVRRKDRATLQQKDQAVVKAKQIEQETRRRLEERRRETLRLIEQENRAAAAKEGAENGLTGGGDPLEKVNTDDEADEAEYESWKLRELRRLKRDKEEREAAEKEKEEVDRLRNMTEDERRMALRNNPKLVTNKAAKGKYKFLQKYYHRGVFFLDTEDDVYKRDFSGATLEDQFDKTILPKVMQVKNFGRSGRTKYTHLVDQDTTSFESPWANDTQINHKFSGSSAGGMKQVFTRPSSHKQDTNAPADTNATNRK